MSMAEGTMPMAADDGLIGFDDAIVSGFHAVNPAGLVPLFLAGIAPIGNGNILFFGAAEADGRAGGPVPVQCIPSAAKARTGLRI